MPRASPLQRGRSPSRWAACREWKWATDEQWFKPVDVVQREPAGSGEGAPHRLEEQVHLPHVFEYRRLTRIEGADDRDVVERIAGHALRGRCYFRQCGG